MNIPYLDCTMNSNSAIKWLTKTKLIFNPAPTLWTKNIILVWINEILLSYGKPIRSQMLNSKEVFPCNSLPHKCFDKLIKKYFKNSLLVRIQRWSFLTPLGSFCKSYSWITHLEQENLHGITIVNATWGAVGPIKM